MASIEYAHRHGSGGKEDDMNVATDWGVHEIPDYHVRVIVTRLALMLGVKQGGWGWLYSATGRTVAQGWWQLIDRALHNPTFIRGVATDQESSLIEGRREPILRLVRGGAHE
jgi:hypothetical protein